MQNLAVQQHILATGRCLFTMLNPHLRDMPHQLWRAARRSLRAMLTAGHMESSYSPALHAVHVSQCTYAVSVVRRRQTLAH